MDTVDENLKLSASFCIFLKRGDFNAVINLGNRYRSGDFNAHRRNSILILWTFFTNFVHSAVVVCSYTDNLDELMMATPIYDHIRIYEFRLLKFQGEILITIFMQGYDNI